MRYSIDCAPNKFDRCLAVVRREIRDRTTKDPSKVFTQHFVHNIGGDRFFIDHQANEITVEVITKKQEESILNIGK